MDFATKRYDELLSYFLHAKSDCREYERTAPHSRRDHLLAEKNLDLKRVLEELHRRQAAD